jgi:hypothetical protein
MHVDAGPTPAGRHQKVALFAVLVGLALAALGAAAVSGPAANAGPVRLTPAEVLGVGLLVAGTLTVLVGLVAWWVAGLTAARAAARDRDQPINHWRAPAVPFGRR